MDTRTGKAAQVRKLAALFLAICAFSGCGEPKGPSNAQTQSSNDCGVLGTRPESVNGQAGIMSTDLGADEIAQSFKSTAEGTLRSVSVRLRLAPSFGFTGVGTAGPGKMEGDLFLSIDADA